MKILPLSDHSSAAKLLILIPCLNEEETLPLVLSSIPSTIKGIGQVEVLVIDDGSTDKTAEVARQHGAHVIRHLRNLGLASSFRRGIDECLRRDADIIVTLDGDNQYRASDIPFLLQPILSGSADVVIGDRQTDQIMHFSLLKKALQKLGSCVVRYLSNAPVKDAVSGFRALTRAAALKLTILNDYTYTVEAILQAQPKGLTVVSVPIVTNEKLRDSRLISSLPSYLVKVGLIILRIFTMYNPLRVFTLAGALFLIPGILGFGRFLFFYFSDGGQGHVQSLVVSGSLVVAGFFLIISGVLADLIQFNRRLSEELLSRVKSLELSHRASHGHSVNTREQTTEISGARESKK